MLKHMSGRQQPQPCALEAAHTTATQTSLLYQTAQHNNRTHTCMLRFFVFAAAERGQLHLGWLKAP